MQCLMMEWASTLREGHDRYEGEFWCLMAGTTYCSILGSLLRLFAVHFDTPYLLETCLLCGSFLFFFSFL